MEERGVLAQKHEAFLADVIASRIKFKQIFLEKIKRRAILILIRGVDNFGIDRLNKSIKDELIPIVDAALEGDKDKVSILVADLANKEIDIPNIDEGMELEFFGHITKALAVAVEIFIRK